MFDPNDTTRQPLVANRDFHGAVDGGEAIVAKPNWSRLCDQATR
jgi:hypothetical protein